MKKIDRSNYEIWLIDWLDGNLNDRQVTQVLQFMEDNRDLKEEFGEIELFRLKPPQSQLHDKQSLKKTTEDLSQTQFEYLCVASLENDLQEDQKTELIQVIRKDPEKRRVYELIRRTRLIPYNVVYPDKKLLIRRTVLENVIRKSFIGLSAAAVITIAFILFFTRQHELPLKYESTSQAIVKDSSQKVHTDNKIAGKETQMKTEPVLKQNKNSVAPTRLAQSSIPDSDDFRYAGSVSARSQILISKIKVHADLNLKSEVPGNLISLNYAGIPVQIDEERSKFSRFIAKNFREKFLKDKTPKDSPLKVYEIAKASVTGLNKLLGWEMALDERKDPNGQLKSVYFSSKILKFNTPVKNTESLR